MPRQICNSMAVFAVTVCSVFTNLIVEIALYKPNGMYIGSVDVDKLFPITAHKLLKIDLNSDIKVKSSCFADCEIITP